MAWSRRFEDPIPLPDGCELVTLRDAGDYNGALPRGEVEDHHWQAAIEALIMAAEDRGPPLHARVGILRALNHGKPAPATTPRRKRAKIYTIIR